MMTAQRDDLLMIALEAKRARDEMGMSDPTADAVLARMQAGDFSGLVSPEALARVEGRTITPDGPQGYKPATVSRVEKGIMIGMRPGNGGNGLVSHTPPARATDPQKGFIHSLLRQLHALDWDGYDAAAWWFLNIEPDLTKAQASDTIKRLKGHLARIKEKSGTPTTPEPAPTPQRPSQGPRWTPEMLHPGRYAVTGNDGTTDFYHVKESRRGNLFVLLQTGDNESFVPWANADTILKRIAADPKEAMLRYGRELGHCGHCGRTLTNEESREVGIGPICRGKMEW